MKKMLLFGFLLSSFISVYGQDSIAILHPIIGDTIDYQEKEHYLLFPELSLEEFEYGIIVVQKRKFYLHAYTPSSSAIYPVDTNQIKEYCTNIDILASYNRTPARSSSPIKSSEKASSMSTDYITPEMKQQLGKEANRHHNAKLDADRQGIFGPNRDAFINGSGYAEIQFKKRNSGNNK